MYTRVRMGGMRPQRPGAVQAVKCSSDHVSGRVRAFRFFPGRSCAKVSSLSSASQPHIGHGSISEQRECQPDPTNSTPTSNASVSRPPSRNILETPRPIQKHLTPYCPRTQSVARRPHAKHPQHHALRASKHHLFRQLWALRAWLRRPSTGSPPPRSVP
jgi:hypothetical protein